jgi:hypothetical protein
LCREKTLAYLPPYDAVIQRRQHAVAPLRGFHSQPIPVVRFCALSNPYGYYRRYALLPSWFSRIHLPISLPSARLCFPCLPRFNPQRYYGDSDSCSAHLRRRSPHLSRHIFLSFRLQPRGLPGHRLPPRQRDQRFSDFAMYEQARRSSPPNRVRYPTDRQFALGCSPPCFAATQLPSATELWLSPAWTFTMLLWRLHGRTHTGGRRYPDAFEIPGFRVALPRTVIRGCPE